MTSREGGDDAARFAIDGHDLAALADLHAGVADGLSDLADPPDAATSLGNIAFAVDTALTGATRHRADAILATQSSGQTIADLLRAAQRRYEQGDRQGAEALEAAATALDRPGGACAGPTEPANQQANQAGQQTGQIAQGVAQAMLGLAQGLGQLPQPILQGVQKIAESAPTKEEPDPADGKRDEDEPTERDDEPRREPRPHPPSAQPAAAPPSHGADTGTPAPVEPPRPAQTRPQQQSADWPQPPR